MLTDGYNWSPITGDMDWENEVEVALLSNCILRDNQDKWRLEFYYTPKGGSANTACAYLHYYPGRIKGSGQAPQALITWPINVKAAGADYATIGNVRHMLTANPDGKVYVEGNGNTDDSGTGISFIARTGDNYLSQFGTDGSVAVKRVSIHHAAAAATQTITGKTVSRNRGETDVDRSWSISATRREPTRAGEISDCEGFQLEAANSDALGSVSINYFTTIWQESADSEIP